uniref:Mos1 transposase HTH domain-containing protein n=1 Tax=Graphocephala atropunctata TaxID=36148 RepID=A0A1B6LY48_9HEMI
MDIKNVRKYCREFTEGRTNGHDEAGHGRPSALEETVTKVEKILFADQSVIVREIAELIGNVSKTTADKILTDILKFQKVCARWMPRMLTDQHKKERMESARECLRRYREESEEF